MPTLIVTTRDGLTTEIQVGEPFFTLGRSSECTVQIRDRSLSKRHARFYQTADGYCVVDAGSKNGVWVGGKRVDRALLRDGDELRFGGQVSLRWLEPQGSEAEVLPVLPAAEPEPGEPPPGPRPAQQDTPPELFTPQQKGLPRLRLREGEKPPVLQPLPEPPVVVPLEERPEPAPPPVLFPRSMGLKPEPEAPLPVLQPRSIPRASTQRPLELVPDTPLAPPPVARGLVTDGGGTASAVAELDPVEAALARIRANTDLEPEKASLHPHLERLRAWAGKLGVRTIGACVVGLLLLAVMTLHSRHVMENRWQEGAAPPALPPPTTPQDPAAVLYRKAEELRASDPAQARRLFGELIARHPESGWADLARARLPQLAKPGEQQPRDPEQDGTVRRLEEAMRAGRYVEAMEGYALLSRTAPTPAQRGQFAQRLQQITERVWQEYRQKRAATVDRLLQEGKKAEAIAAAEKLLARYPLARVRKDLETRTGAAEGREEDK